MPILDGFICDNCGEQRDGWRDEPRPRCCRDEMRKIFCTNTFEWGGPRRYRELRDEPFKSRSELNAWAKANNLEQVGDKVGGARNEDHRNLGKHFSYKGGPKRTSELSRRSNSAHR